MKTLTDITTSLELSKQLKECGFPQKDSLFYWWTDSNDGTARGIYDHQPFNPQNGWDDYAAPTAIEILAELPAFIENSELYIEPGPVVNTWLVGYRDNIKHIRTSIANAASEMYLHLVKNGLLKGGGE